MIPKETVDIDEPSINQKLPLKKIICQQLIRISTLCTFIALFAFLVLTLVLFMSKSKDAEYIKNIKMSAVICLICSIAPFIIVNIFQNSNNRKGQILNGSGQENDMLPPSTSNTFRNTLTILSTGVNIIHSIAIL